MFEDKIFKNFNLLKTKIKQKIGHFSGPPCMVPEKTYLENLRKNTQNWTRPENFDIWFCLIFDCLFQKVISGKRLDTRLCEHSNLRFF